MKKRKINVSLILQYIYLVAFIACFLWFVIMQFTAPSERNPEDYYVTTFDDGWYHVEKDGTRTPFQIPGSWDGEPGDTAVFEKTLNEDLPMDMWLCFKTSKQDMSVYIDGELRGNFSTKETRPFGLSSPSAYFFVNLNSYDAGKVISVKITGESTYSTVFQDILYGDKSGILHELTSGKIVVLLLAIIILVLGIVSMFISFFLQIRTKETIPLAYLSWCAIAVAAWIIAQSSLRQIFFPNVSATALFARFVLLLLPIPFAIYFNMVQKKRYKYIYWTIEVSTYVHFIIGSIAIAHDRLEMSSLDLSTYLIMAALIIVVLTTMVIDVKRKFVKEYPVVLGGIIAFFVAAIIQIAQTFNKEIVISGNTLCYGFITLLFTASVQAVLDALVSSNAKKQAIAANQAKANFLASMSHEIRTPINAVLGIDEMILSESNEDKIREYAKDIQTAGRTLLAIINDILDFSKIESGKMTIVPMEYDLASVINDSCNMIRSKADEKKLIFHTLCDTHLPSRLLGDEVRIRQIFTNLLSNAVKYTEHGSITFSVTGNYEDDGNFILEATIRDTGIGIKEENIPYLFDSFSRVDDDVTHRIEGSGLGLSIVKNLLDLMGGEIKIESEFGKGSSFTILIPQRILSETPIGSFAGDFSLEDHPATEDDFMAPGARILAVDDVAMNLKVFCGLLKDTLIVIDTATSGKSCIAKMRSEHYDMVFLDHMMPEMDGIETLRELQAMDKNITSKTPIIMLTANAILGAKEEYLRQGFCDYLSKPIQKDRLLAMLKQYLPAELILRKDKGRSSENSFSLENIAFLNTEIGLSYHAGDKDFYLEIIKAFEEDNRLTPLQTYYDEEDWHNYRILVHSLSSSSKIIGATELSNMAKQLENAAKVNSIDYIRSHHMEMMASYQALLSNLRTFLLQGSGMEIPKSSNNFHILVVDDDKINLKTARKILKDHYQITCLESGKEALDFLEEQLPDMILLDIHMPEMDGFDVLKVLKANQRTKNIPVVFLTADADYETELSGFKAGAADYIRKPFIPDIMLERLTRIIENDRIQQSLQSEVDRSNSKVESLSLQAMMTLAQTIDAKDKYTKGHSTRVASYSKQLAKYLGLSEKEQDTIYYMGLLHDIGKIGVPDYIITKAAKLTAEEYSIIKKHTTTGYDILKNFGEIPNIEQCARWHHERMDGTGYPDGLKGEEIPLLVRIISVADTFDAMTSKRIYRDILPRDYIREELERGKGTQFDPMIAEAMLQIMDEITFDIID